MTGTLELLVGPSGVGKTSSIDDGARSCRVTTRPKREGETSQDGFFVSEDNFLKMLAMGELIGTHRYPDPLDGELYGFDKMKIQNSLYFGDNIVEQIVDLNAANAVASKFNGQVKKKLFLAFDEDLEFRITGRNDTRADREKRLEAAKHEKREYLKHINDFDSIVIIPPYSAMVDFEKEKRDREHRASWDYLTKEIETLQTLIDRRNKQLKGYDLTSPDIPKEIKGVFQLKKEAVEKLDRLTVLMGNSFEAMLKRSLQYSSIDVFDIDSKEAEPSKGSISVGGNFSSAIKRYKDEARKIEAHPFYVEMVHRGSQKCVFFQPTTNNKNAHKYYFKNGIIHCPDYFTHETRAAITRITHLYQHAIHRKNKHTKKGNQSLYQEKDDNLNTMELTSSIPEFAYPYLPVIISAMHEEAEMKEEGFRMLEETLEQAEREFPEIFSMNFLFSKSYKNCYLYKQDNISYDQAFDSISSMSENTLFGRLIKKTIEVSTKGNNHVFLIDHSDYKDEPQQDIEHVKKHIVQQVISGLSLIEDRYNRLTGQTTSRWPVKQEMINEAMKYNGGKGHYAPY